MLAALCRLGEPIEPGPHGRVRVTDENVAGREPAFQHGEHHRAEFAESGERAEQPRQRRFQRRGALQAGHAVALEHSLQPVSIPRRQTGEIRIEPLQERQQELLGVFGRCRFVELDLGLRPIQRAQLGVDVEQAVLTREQRGIVRFRDLGESPLLREQLAQLSRATGRIRAGSRPTGRRRGRTACASDRHPVSDPTGRRAEPPHPPCRRANPGCGVCTSGAPRSTCAFGMTDTSTTSPAIGAVTVVSIFIDSRTTTASPAATVSPGSTSALTTSAGHPARSATPSSRSITCVAASSSTRNPVSVGSTTRRYRRPPHVIRRSNASSSSTVMSATSDPLRMEYRRGPTRSTSSRYDGAAVAEFDPVADR